MTITLLLMIIISVFEGDQFWHLYLEKKEETCEDGVARL